MRFDVNLLLTKLYYELEYFEACYSLIDSFTNLITNSRIFPERLKLQYLNYLKLYKLLLDMKSGTRYHYTDMITKEIIKMGKVKNTRWLKEKVAEFET